MNMSIYVMADYVVKQKKSKIYNADNNINIINNNNNKEIN